MTQIKLFSNFSFATEKQNMPVILNFVLDDEEIFENDVAIENDVILSDNFSLNEYEN